MALSSLKTAKPDNSGESAAKAATNMLFFWLVAGIMILKDIIDLFLSGIEAMTAATVIGIPISIACMILGGIMTLTVGIIAMIYHLYSRRGIMTKFMITSICALMGMIPIINLLPDASIAFFASFFVGRAMGIAKKVISGAGRLVIPST